MYTPSLWCNPNPEKVERREEVSWFFFPKDGAADDLPVGLGALATITQPAVPSGQYPSDGILARAPEAGSNRP